MNLQEIAEKEFEEFEKQENELKEQLAKIKKRKASTRRYLQDLGVIEVKKRGRRKKASTEEATS